MQYFFCIAAEENNCIFGETNLKCGNFHEFFAKLIVHFSASSVPHANTNIPRQLWRIICAKNVVLHESALTVTENILIYIIKFLEKMEKILTLNHDKHRSTFSHSICPFYVT